LPILGFGQGQPAPTAQDTFDINNIKTMVGPAAFFWDLNDAQFEVPNGSGKHAIFAHEFWIGGVDNGGQLKAAANTYRQGGNDWWAGPLDVVTASVAPNQNAFWDNVWKINKSEIDYHISNIGINPTYVIPNSILDWPAHGDPLFNHAHYLAPFIDTDSNGIYEPYNGDYPKIKGDQALFMIRNDKGNIHTETEAEPIGIEQHIMFYGYKCDNHPELNNTVFVNMKLINRSVTSLNDTYIGLWTDYDLGWYLDDYVGCNVGLSLGYAFNGDAHDEGAAGYGFHPPSIGTVLLGGPRADAFDGIDNDRDGFIDEIDSLINPVTGQWTYMQYEEIMMSKFVYYNNDITTTGNPSTGTHFYNYLKGIWKDNIPMTYGGNGKGSGPGATTSLCNFMFPDTTDASFPGQSWAEVTAGNVPGDRRCLQSAGPFTLEPGAVRYINYAFVFAQDTAGNNVSSLDSLFSYVDRIRNFYDGTLNINCQNPTIVIEDISLLLEKKLLKITDILGRETKGTKNDVLFYIYDDGTVEKRIIIE
jgi:hypothetical protein